MDLRKRLQAKRWAIRIPKAVRISKIARAVPNPMRDFTEDADFTWKPVNYANMSRFHSGKTFGYWLSKRKGWTKLGSGCYSAVYAKDGSNKVLKVHWNPSDGWINYIQWAHTKGYTGSFAPKVYSYKWVKGTKADFAISSVERMADTFHNVDRKDPLQAVTTLIGLSRYGNETAGLLMDIVIPGVKKFADELVQEFRDANFDLHYGNMMVRSDKTLCFTDPIVFSEATVIKDRLRFN